MLFIAANKSGLQLYEKSYTVNSKKANYIGSMQCHYNFILWKVLKYLLIENSTKNAHF
jgi:hypothetical protein